MFDLSHRALKRQSIVYFSALVLSACTASPRNGTAVSDRSEPYPFTTFGIWAGETVTFQVKNQINPTVWENLGTAVAGTEPVLTDNGGIKWYAAQKDIPLPVSATKTRLWRKASTVNGQRRIAATFRSVGSKYGTFHSFDTDANACINAQANGADAVLNCKSGNSPEAELYLSCGRPDQSCCLSHEVSSPCDLGRACSSTGYCTTPTGNEGQACNEDGTCNGSRVVCNKDRKCVDAKSSTTRWWAGYQGCMPGQDDCNACADNVVAQLTDAVGADNWFNTGDSGEAMSWSNDSWSFGWQDNYGPSNAEPDNVFGGHVQGFVRTNRDPIRFAGTYDADDGVDGGFFFIERHPDRSKTLKYIHRARHSHPSGISVLGKYVLGSDSDDEVRFIDMERLSQNHELFMKVPNINRAGGGIAMSRLQGDGYLLAVQPSGGYEGSTRIVRFFHVHGTLASPGAAGVKEVGVWNFTGPGTSLHTENLNVINECGTGEIYVLRTGGDDSFFGNGYWSLYKLAPQEAGGVGLKAVAYFRQDQDQNRCHPRSTATTWVDPATGQIDLICHERKAVKNVSDHILTGDSMRFLYGG